MGNQILWGAVGAMLGLSAGWVSWQWARKLLGEDVALTPTCWICLISSFAWAGLWWQGGFSVETVELSLLCVTLMTLSLTDQASFTIPDVCTAAAFAVRVGYLVWVWATGGDVAFLVIRSLVGLVVTLVPLLALTLAMDRVLGTASLGGGDLKLLAVAGAYVGWEMMPFLLLMACCGGIVTSWVRARGHMHAMEPFPFGPAIAAAFWISLLVSPHVEAWFTAWVF